MEVVLYVQHGCGPCLEAKAWLTARALRFESRDVGARADWLGELAALGSRVTPTVVVQGPSGRTVVTGFRPDALEAALRERSPGIAVAGS